MPRLKKWDTYVRCLRSVPFTVSGECDGEVRVHGYSYPAGKDGPAGGIANVDECPRCHFADWSPEEIHELTVEAQGAKNG